MYSPVAVMIEKCTVCMSVCVNVRVNVNVCINVCVCVCVQLCQLCCRDDNEAQLLLCDMCDRGYHTYCIKV